ncbi:MAG: C25 family cysteine peptidase [Thermoplasmatota archaeon]
MNLEILIEFALSEDREEIRILEGGIDAGEQGEARPFLSIPIMIEGTLSCMQVDFKDPKGFDICAAPYILPSVLGSGETEEHPEWKGCLDRDIEESWSIEPLSKIDGTNRFSLKLRPVHYFLMGGAEGYTRAVVTFIYSPSPVLRDTFFSENRPTGPVKYLIITHEDLVEGVRPLANWKSQRGVFARIVTTEEINSMYGSGDIQYKMRRFVQEMEQLYDLDYLLLAGDIGLVRTRNTLNLYPEVMYGEPSTFATDGYFACVDPETSWNKDGDSSYVEIGEMDDPLPDMAVGRLAVDSLSQLSQLVRNYIDRERNFTWESEMEKAIFIAGDPQSVPGYPPDTLDHFWSTYGSSVFSGRETIYYDNSGTLTFGASSFRDTVGDKHQAICYFSHGTQTGLPGLFSSSQVSTLHDTGPEGSFFAMACLTGYFDGSTDCFAETITTTPGKGLLGYIGSSRLAVGGIDTQYEGDAPGLEEDYWRMVKEAASGNITPTVGDIYRGAVTHFVDSFYPFPTNYNGYSAFRTYLEYNLLGEPEAPLFFHPPERLNLQFELSRDNTSVQAFVTNSTGHPIENATVSLFREGQLGVAGRTNSSGYVNISIPPSNGGIVNITASKPGELPSNSTLVLPDHLTPFPLYSIDPPQPDGWNNTYKTHPIITMKGDEDVLVEWLLDGVQMGADLFSPLVVYGPEGHHEISFRVTDHVGHVSNWTSFNFTVDTTAPELFIRTDPEVPDGLSGWFTSIPRVYVESNEELTEIYYKIGGLAETPYLEPVELYNGEHSITFRALDKTGNQNTSTGIIKVDLTSPYSTMTVSHGPDGDNGYYINPPSIVLEGFDDNGASIVYRWDGGGWTNYTAPIYPPFGVHFLEYRAIDSTGNNETTTNFQWFKYDPFPPELIIKVDPEIPDGANGWYVTNPKVNATINGTEFSQSSIHFVIAQPGQGFDWSNDSMRAQEIMIIPEGEWMLYFLAVDEAGNQDYPNPLRFKVDTTPPVLTVNITPTQPDGANGWYITNPTVKIDNISRDATGYLSMDGNSTWMEITENGLELPEGVHSFNVLSVDQAGNEGSIYEFSYRADLLDPTAVVSSPRSQYFINETVTFDATASYDENGIVSYLFESFDGLSSSWLKAPQWITTFNRTGNYSIMVRVLDPSGRNSTSHSLNVTILEPPPQPMIDDDPPDGLIPYDPTPERPSSWTNPSKEERKFIRASIILILILVISILLILVVRRSRIKEVDWEDEDSWLDEDWVDVDLDEEPVIEEDVIIFE